MAPTATDTPCAREGGQRLASWPLASLVTVLCFVGLGLFQRGLVARQVLEPAAVAGPSVAADASEAEVRYLDQVALLGPELKLAGAGLRRGGLFILGAAWMLAALGRLAHLRRGHEGRAALLRALWLLPAAWALAELAVHAGARAPMAGAAQRVFSLAAPVLLVGLVLAVPWRRAPAARRDDS